jgi:hypothetical protein
VTLAVGNEQCGVPDWTTTGRTGQVKSPVCVDRDRLGW